MSNSFFYVVRLSGFDFLKISSVSVVAYKHRELTIELEALLSNPF